MITNNGKELAKRVLAGNTGTFAKTIAVGIGNTAATSNDTALEFEIERFDVNVSYITSTDKLVFKASIPEDIECNLYEIGLFSYKDNPFSGSYIGQTISLFNQSEVWGTLSGSLLFSTNHSRYGGQTLKQAEADEFFLIKPLDLSGYSNTDTFTLGGYLDTTPGVSVSQYSANGTTKIVTLTVAASHGFVSGDRISVSNVAAAVNGIHTITSVTSTTISYEVPTVTTSSATGLSGSVDPYSEAHIVFNTGAKKILYTVGLGTADGYVINSFVKEDNDAYIDFDWGLIESVEVRTTGNGSHFYWDALRVIDSDISDPDMVMIARFIPASPIQKESGVPLEIQYEMDISVGN